ncbi:hypothetical protein [Streptomyces sp. NBC_01006]|uniref:hypothetical protein n=1 Tax=Streptomyces sp. NBC_01006 TaxID=2903716 RepID=UPI0038635DAC|nr:hypothetical protein OG509_01665 [Streptomyces sp. NBC_01006]
MVEVVRWIVWALIAAAVLICLHHYRYPGGWGPAFSREHAARRRNLARARRHLARRAVWAWGQRALVQARLHSAQSAHRQSVAAAKLSLRQAREPGLGVKVGELGPLVLHEHVLLRGEEQLPLASLEVKPHHDVRNHHLILVQDDGSVHHVSLARTEHEEDAVFAFVALLTSAVLRENAFLSGQGKRIARAEERLARIEADTSAQDGVRTELDRLVEEQRLDPEQAAALARLKACRQDWHEHTGRMPPAPRS